MGNDNMIWPAISSGLQQSNVASSRDELPTPLSMQMIGAAHALAEAWKRGVEPPGAALVLSLRIAEWSERVAELEAAARGGRR